MSDLVQRLRRGSSDLSGQAMEEAADRIEAQELILRLCEQFLTEVHEEWDKRKQADRRVFMLHKVRRALQIEEKIK